MKKFYFLLLILLFQSNSFFGQFNFQRSWGSYYGDERLIFTDSAVDNNGNLYVIGAVNGENLTNLISFTNTTSYHQNFGGGISDGFLIKFNSQGQLIWGTFIGGEGYEELTAIDVDNLNNIYVVGFTNSLNNISSVNSFQPALSGESDFFISKFNDNGFLLFSTYFGGSNSEFTESTIGTINPQPKRLHICVDNMGSFYISGTTNSTNLSTPGVFQELKGNSNQILVKFSKNLLTSGE